MDMLRYFFNIVKPLTRDIKNYKKTNFSKSRIYGELLTNLGNAKLFELDPYKIKKVIDSKLLTLQPEAQLDIVNYTGTDENLAMEFVKSFNFNDLKFPANMMYVGYPSPYKIIYLDNKSNIKTKVINETGIFISKDMIAVFTEYIADSGKITYGNTIYYYRGMWKIPDKDSTWQSKQYMLLTMYSILEIVNSYETITIHRNVEKPPVVKRVWLNKRRAKKSPSAYYKIKLRNKTIIKNNNEENIGIRTVTERLNARFVKGHHAHRILIGSLPMQERLERYLIKDPRRKIFYDHNQIDDSTYKVLTDREIFIKDGEWVSVLKYWVDSYDTNINGGINKVIPVIYTEI